MRKEYVKPVMESEEFVSNEYVAACWTMECECGSEEVYSSYESRDDFLKGQGVITYDNEMIYQGSINGSAGCCNDSHTDSNGSYDRINALIRLINYFIPGTKNDLPYFSADKGLGEHHALTSVKKGHGDNHPNAS